MLGNMTNAKWEQSIIEDCIYVVYLWIHKHILSKSFVCFSFMKSKNWKEAKQLYKQSFKTFLEKLKVNSGNIFLK